MCLSNIERSKSKKKVQFGYKILERKDEQLYTYFADQQIKSSTKVWQKAEWKTKCEVDYTGIPSFGKEHLNKISVFLDMPQDNILRHLNSTAEIWKVELRYRNLLTGDFYGKCALVDRIRLVERVK